MSHKVFLALQTLAGLLLVVFGANKFFGFLSMSPPSAELGSFIGALFATGYLMKIVAVIEIAAGLSFVLNKYVALMALVLFPVMLNAFLAHLFLDPSGIAGAAVLTVATVLVMFKHLDDYAKLLRP